MGVESSAMPGALRAVVPCPAGDVQPAPPSGGVACRCCPGQISRSTRPRRYPSDVTEAEWAVCEPLLPAPAWLAGRGGRPALYCMRDIVTRSATSRTTGRCGGHCPPTSRPPGPCTTGPANGRTGFGTEELRSLR